MIHSHSLLLLFIFFYALLMFLMCYSLMYRITIEWKIAFLSVLHFHACEKISGVSCSWQPDLLKIRYFTLAQFVAAFVLYFWFLSIRVKMKFHLSTIADIDFISTRQLVECLLKSQIFVQLTVTASNQRRLAWFHRKISASKAELLQCLHEGRRKTHRTFHYFPRRSQNSENNSEWVRDERAWTTVNWISHLIQWKMCWIIKVNHRRAEEEHNETNWRNRWLACPSPFCLPCCCCFNFIPFFIFLSSLPPLSRLRYSSSSFHSPLSPLIAFSASHPWCMHRKLLLGWWEEESCERATKLFFNTSSCI